jgi:diacylglycerol kinase family enzyme
MHVLLVRNDASGSADEVDPAAAIAASGSVVTEADLDRATRWSRSPARSLDDVERVVVAGGDGSIGVAALLATRLDVPLGVVPAGTANDFARAMDLHDDLEDAVRVAAFGEQLREIDLGRIGDRAFVNVASLGLAPAAAKTARPLKRGIGALAYPVGALVAAVRTRPVVVSARIDGHLVWTGKAWQVMVASSGAFGGWADTGATTQGDGQLDLVVVPAGRGTRELAFDAAALARGELAHRYGVHHDRGRVIELSVGRAPSMVVDGEVVDLDAAVVTARVDERRLRVVVG